MARIIFFDADPAGLACHKPGNYDRDCFYQWMIKESVGGAVLIIPAIVDYEVRRELIRTEAWTGVKRLDALYATKRVRLLAISDQAMRKAASLWAGARRKGQQTADDLALDGDVILSAQAIEFCSDSDDWIILTNNVTHIARYVGENAVSRPEVVENWMKSKRSIHQPDEE